jgi:polar amino acid transport system substrate-binding protein
MIREIAMTPSRFCLAVAALMLLPMTAAAQDSLRTEIAPGGKLRVALIGVRVLGGVGEPVGAFLAERLGLPFEAVTYRNPQAYEESFAAPAWDVAIGPRVLAPADKADVTHDAWLIELLYLAAPGHEFSAVREVDHAGVKIGTIQNSPSDRFLSHTLKSATLVRLPLSPRFPADAVDMLRNGTADVFGADSGLIAAISGGYPEGRIVPGAFNTVRVAFALPKGRSAAAQARLAELLAEAKRTGVVQKAIEHAGLKTGVRVAPE